MNRLLALRSPSRLALVLWGVSALGVAAWATLRPLASPVAPPSSLLSSQILEVHPDSLTTYKAAKTRVQDVKPQDEQRGLSLDGSLRKGSTFPMAVAGNPFERAFAGEAESNGVRLDTGTWAPTFVDLSLPAPGHRWTIGRTFNCRQDDSGQFDSAGYQGVSWFQTSQPEIRFYDDADNTKDLVYLVWGADRYAEFKRENSTSNQFKAKNGAAGCFDYQSGSPDLYVYTDQVGTVFTFFGFNTSSARADGQLWKIEDTAGNKAYVGDPTTASTAVTSGYDTGSRMTKAVDTADRRYTYTYNADSPPHLTQVKAETKTGGTWEGTPTGVVEVGKVDYTYYGNESNGDPGDLKTVKVTLPLSDSGVNEIRVQYFRYWEGTFNASTNPGYPHQVKLFLDEEGARKYDWGDSTFDDDFLTETTDNLKPYASAYFEHESGRKVNKAWTSGQCGCSGAGTGTHEYRYETNASYSDNSGYDTAWARRTSVKHPDTSWMTQYFDETGQALHHVITDADPANTDPAPSKWVTKVTRDSSGRVTEVSTPANVTAYTHSSASITTSTSGGLVSVFTRASSGDMTGFVTAEKFKTGTGGSEYYLQSRTWTSITKSITDVTVVRPLVSAQRIFPTAQTTETGYNETAFAYTSYSGASPSQPLAVEKVTTTNPAVATANNGLGSTILEYDHFKKDGLLDFHSESDGTYRIISYKAYTKGLATTNTPDANTTSLSPPSTDFEHSGTPLNNIATNAYDEQGRLETETLPDGRVVKHYYTMLKDRRLVQLDYPKYVSGSGTYYGPVDYRVTNHAGKPEVDGTIAFTGGSTTTSQTSHIDETDVSADPITSVDTGSVAQMRAFVYDEAGTQLEEERAYFSIPTSGAGTDGTHYDPVKYGYDDSGRRRRVKEAHGTITRTVYDSIGRTSATWVGTNDSSFPGGESGTDNMVKVTEWTYDSGTDGGNSYVTKVTQYIQDSATDKRETTYSNDVRGNALLVTNPQSPHVFNKFDTQSRVIASGGFSSTASIDTAADDPTTETTNRLTLSQTFYDEMGRVWKTQRHKINQSTGADDDNLQTLSWRDRLGRLAKVDGEPALEKWTYDREGKQTHHFVLAIDNDTTYADALAKSDDQVLVEEQQVYDSAGEVLMGARIDRFHSDKGVGSTSGPLDTAADADDLLYTASNVKGRIQITATWYDSIGRLQDQVAYGTNGGSNFDRDGLAVPARSDTALRTTYTYNDDGTLKEISDPKDLETRFEYDALGRRTKVTANYVDGTPGGGANGDEDQVVSYAFTDGLETSITADLPAGETDQVTTYIYGSTKGTPTASKLATGHLLRAVKYPDSTNNGTTLANINTDSSDVVSFAFNAQSEETYKKDQAGNVFETDLDTGGRETHRRVTTLASGFDGAVRRISTTYESRGIAQLVTQYDNATVGSGSVVDEVKYMFDGWGNLTNFEQDRDSAVAGGGNDYEVTYTYTKSTTGRNTIKLSTEALGGGKTFEYSYRSAGGLFDLDVSRVSQIKDNGTALVTYDYNGLDQVVGTYLEEPDMMWKQYTATAGDYADLDRFNRVTTSKWTKDLATDRDLYKVEVGWDRNSNVTHQDDSVHAGFDVIYTNENLNRLTRAEEGTKSGGSITSRTRDQQWTLNQTGNWELDKVDLNGDGDFVDANELNDDRTHNVVNELTARDTDDNGADNYTLTYDAAGNLTDDGQSYKYEWDAFYRLRKVKNQSNAEVAEFKYNGLGYRISVHEDTDADGDVDASDKWFHTAYDERWRGVGTFRESDTSPKEQFLCHAAGLDGDGTGSYIDLVLRREKDANTAWTSASDGVLEEKLDYLQNWRADVVGLVSSGSQQKEQVRYSAYGIPFGLPGGDCDSDGDCDSTDVTQVQTWIDASAYDVRGDIDLDGDVDATDKSTIQTSFQGQSAGRNTLSTSIVKNNRGLAGYSYAPPLGRCAQVRARVISFFLGRWIQRDPSDYLDGAALYAYARSSPIGLIDPLGLKSACPSSGNTLSMTLPNGPSMPTCAFARLAFINEVNKKLKEAVKDNCDPTCPNGWPCTPHATTVGPGAWGGGLPNGCDYDGGLIYMPVVFLGVKGWSIDWLRVLITNCKVECSAWGTFEYDCLCPTIGAGACPPGSSPGPGNPVSPTSPAGPGTGGLPTAPAAPGPTTPGGGGGTCGNNWLDPGEQCDKGATNAPWTCGGLPCVNCRCGDPTLKQ